MSFQRFLLKYKVDKGHPFTHTSIGKPKGSYYVPVDDEVPFYEAYKEAYANDEAMHITEKHREISPILIDLDFRFKITPPDQEQARRRYTFEHIVKIMTIYMKNLAEFVDLELADARIYVMEKPSARIEKNKFKDGVHIMIPEIVTEPHLQMMLRERVLAEMGEVFKEIGIDNSAADCFDEAVIQRNNWLMYASKKPDNPAYEVTHILKRLPDDQIIELPLLDDKAEYVELLSIRNKSIETDFVSDAKKGEVSEWVQRTTRRPASIPSSNTFFVTDEGADVVRNMTKDLLLVQKLVDMLDKERSHSYDTWIRLGWCLRNIDYRLLDKWIQFSKNSDKFVEGECAQLWEKMRVNGGLGIATLKMWASKDNSEAYKEIVRDDVFSYIQKAYTGTHYDVACVIYAMYGSEFVCASIKNRFWYEFRSHRWHPCEEGMTLSMRISVQVCQEFSHVAAGFNQKAASTTDDAQQRQYIEISQKLNKVALLLKNTTFKKNVMQECMAMFFVNKFEEKLDSRCHLLGFENGIYDLEALAFRDGMPDDCISFSTGISFVPFVEDCDEHKCLVRYFEQVFPNPRVRKYVLMHLSSCLNGNVKEERFHIWTGTGSNSKSIVVSLFEKCFGDYCCKLPVSLLTNKRAASNAASSEIARTKGRRFAVLQEPSENEVFNVGLMKELTGGDKIMARSLYKEPVEFLPQMKMVLTCNHLPEVHASDDGTWRRIRLVEFVSKFTDTPDPTKENEFPIVRGLIDKMDEWKETFMTMLIEIYKKYCEEGLVEPEEVLKATREYQRNNDFIGDFIDSCSVDTENAYVSISEVYNVFKSWVKENNPDIKVQNRREFIRLVCKVWGKEQRGRSGSTGWYGHRVAFNPYDNGDGGGGDGGVNDV